MIRNIPMKKTCPWAASAMVADRVTFSALPDSHLGDHNHPGVGGGDDA